MFKILIFILDYKFRNKKPTKRYPKISFSYKCIAKYYILLADAVFNTFSNFKKKQNKNKCSGIRLHKNSCLASDLPTNYT